MGKKKKRKLTAAEKREKKRRREEYEIIFINGKQKRVKRPPKIDGLDVDEFTLTLQKISVLQFRQPSEVHPENALTPFGQTCLHSL